MKNRFTTTLLTTLLLCANIAFGQMVNDCVFLKGRYVELGIAPNGGYGSTVPAPPGYHPNNPAASAPYTLYDPATAVSNPPTSLIGFVADYGRDGWTVGTPPYFGDFYMPGHPQEGWAIQVGGGLGESNAYIPTFITVGSNGYTSVSGTGVLTGTNFSYVNNAAGISKGIWKGNFGALAVRQTTRLDTNKLYFTVNVVLTNTSTTTPLTNIYYVRTVDPDNEITTTGSFVTINKIAYQNDTAHRVLVSTTGNTLLNDYLGLGTKDCRAKCMIFNAGLDPTYPLDVLWNQTNPYFYALGHVDTADVGIALEYNIGTILPGDSTSLTYAYILNAAYIDTALDATKPTYTVNTTNFSSSATINLCTYGADTVHLSITDGDFYNWTWAPNLYIASTTGTSNLVFSRSITATMTYTITGVNKSGSCDSVFYFLTVKYDTFNVPGVINARYCLGDVAVPLINPPIPAGGTTTWWTSLYGGVGSPVPPTPSTATAGTQIYYVSQGYGSCNSVRSPDTVIVSPIPIPPFLYDPNPYCFGATFIPPTATATGVVWWFPSAVGGTGVAFPPTINTSVPGTTTIYASQTVNGCSSTRAALPITVLDSIGARFTYTKTYGCGTDTVRFHNLTAHGSRYVWQFGDGSSDTVANPMHFYTSQDTFKVTLTSSNAVCDDTEKHAFSFVHPLKSYFHTLPNLTCQNQPIKFFDSSIGIGRTYRWDFGDGSAALSGNATHTFANAGTYIVKHIVTDFVPCNDTAYGTIQVDPISSLNMAITDTTICQGTYITLSAKYSDSGNTGIVWQFGGPDSIKNVNPIIRAFDYPGKITVTVTATYRACRDTNVMRDIYVYQHPLLDIGTDTSICAGSEAMTIFDRINTTKGNPGASWLWSTGETTQAITITAPGKYYVTVSNDGCKTSDTIEVANACYIDIPNVFTPNGDGLNDYFFPRALLTAGLTSFKMEIYNRWGQLIFKTDALSGQGWDGKYNGVIQPQDVFIYSIDATFKDGKMEHHKGNVTLLR